MSLVTQLTGDKMRLFKNKFANWILILDYNNMWWHLNREKSFFQSYGILGFFKNFNNDLVILTDGISVGNCTITIRGFSKGLS